MFQNCEACDNNVPCKQDLHTVGWCEGLWAITTFEVLLGLANENSLL